MTMKQKYSLYVGNIGHIDDYNTVQEAMKDYNEYVELSQNGYGRCAYEEVTLFDLETDEIVLDYQPELVKE